MVEYEKLDEEATRWDKLMQRTKNLRDKIWQGVKIGDKEDG